MYLENDPMGGVGGYGPATPHPGAVVHHTTHLSPPASLARVSPQDSDPLSDPLYHDRAPYSYR